MLDYSLVVNKKENYISLENKKNIILLDFENQIISKKERKLDGVNIDFTVEEFIYINNLFGELLRGEFNGR